METPVYLRGKLLQSVSGLMPLWESPDNSRISVGSDSAYNDVWGCIAYRDHSFLFIADIVGSPIRTIKPYLRRIYMRNFN